MHISKKERRLLRAVWAAIGLFGVWAIYVMVAPGYYNERRSTIVDCNATMVQSSVTNRESAREMDWMVVAELRCDYEAADVPALVRQEMIVWSGQSTYLADMPLVVSGDMLTCKIAWLAPTAPLVPKFFARIDGTNCAVTPNELPPRPIPPAPYPPPRLLDAGLFFLYLKRESRLPATPPLLKKEQKHQ